jgi:hypothetical protein
MTAEQIPQRIALRMFLAAIAGDEPRSSLTEIRWRERPGQPMHQEFFFCQAPKAIIERVTALSTRGDVYLGAAPRVRSQGTAAAVERAWSLWVDLDEDDAIERLSAFTPQPSLVLLTGTGGHAQALWALNVPLARRFVAQANRRLAHALGGDRASTDPARILRAPMTANFKHSPAVPVECVRLELDVFAASDVVAHLPDPPEDRREPARRVAHATPVGGDPDDVLRGIPASEYVPALTGRQVGRDGKACCPWHGGGDERTPSLHAYDDPDRGYFCFGCDEGGTIIDFGGRLYGIDPRGRGFHEIRRRLAADLLSSAAA